ncbi:MAG: gluconokinase [Desulfobacterales bacterium]|nr:gluconokinase [Desulfobacterales bacterium]
MPSPLIIILLGVAGSGKTTVGKLLAADLSWRFHDADEFHPRANILKMKQGHPLTDADRRPWLDLLAGLIRSHINRQEPAVVACSALKQKYRDRLAGACPRLVFVHLRGDPELIRQRLTNRSGHFFHPGLLAGQFADLEEPADGLVVDIALSPAEIVALIREQPGLRRGEQR